MVCLEMSFKGIFMISNYGVERMFDQAFIIDYVVETVISDFNGLPISRNDRDSILEIFKEITGVDNPDTAIRSMALKSLKTDDVKEIVDNIFVNKYSSFKENTRD